ncbi:hypothetical protein ACJJI3_09530 [Microbulbifer sp. ZKSA004]|uniref:hypothetical protein n=1 Tax=unclassified Microbulbifer TaxID=2619833 RepID=UPI0040393F01
MAVEVMSDYQINVIRQVWVLLIFYPFISAFYYANSKSFLQSAHGIIALIGFAYAVVACEFTDFGPPDYWYWPIYFCFMLSFASIVYSLKAFKGKKYIHVIHGVTIIANLLTTFVALMAVAHDWI